MSAPTAITELTLKTGEILHLDIYQPGVAEPRAPLEDIRDLIVQPRQSWFGPADREEVERSLAACRRERLPVGAKLW